MRFNNALVGTGCVFNGVMVIKRFQGIGYIFTTVIDSRLRKQFFGDTVNLEFRKRWRRVLFVHKDVGVYWMINGYEFDLVEIGGLPQFLCNLNGIFSGFRLYLRP